MTSDSPTILQRLRSARRMLFGRGDDAVLCSFCGRGRHEQGRDIVVGPGVAICGPCAGLALGWTHSLQLGEAPDGRRHETFQVLEAPMSLLPVSRDRVGLDLEACAQALSCELVSWGYFCAQGRAGDGLSVHIHVPAEANAAILQGTFVRSFLEGDAGA